MQFLVVHGWWFSSLESDFIPRPGSSRRYQLIRTPFAERSKINLSGGRVAYHHVTDRETGDELFGIEVARIQHPALSHQDLVPIPELDANLMDASALPTFYTKDDRGTFLPSDPPKAFVFCTSAHFT